MGRRLIRRATLLLPSPGFSETRLYHPRHAEAPGCRRRPPSMRRASGGVSAAASSAAVLAWQRTKGCAVHALPSQTRHA
eukprot:scaffold240451_cov27-Tisochrysis_lutea.AAC.5